jgi:hypothetical protein
VGAVPVAAACPVGVVVGAAGRGAGVSATDVYRDVTFTRETRDLLQECAAIVLDYYRGCEDGHVRAIRDVIARWDANAATDTLFSEADPTAGGRPGLDAAQGANASSASLNRGPRDRLITAVLVCLDRGMTRFEIERWVMHTINAHEDDGA